MTLFTVQFPDGTWIPVNITASNITAAPTNTLKPHTVTFGRAPGPQFRVTLTPGGLATPPAPITAPIIDVVP